MSSQCKNHSGASFTPVQAFQQNNDTKVRLWLSMPPHISNAQLGMKFNDSGSEIAASLETSSSSLQPTSSQLLQEASAKDYRGLPAGAHIGVALGTLAFLMLAILLTLILRDRRGSPSGDDIRLLISRLYIIYIRTMPRWIQNKRYVTKGLRQEQETSMGQYVAQR
ncbi:hypothetical protein BKA62DRAFT_203435 [Auriculariales sp. MPI-PUGE-AT-0066]|nr:hypothetical protein BKA62DRAFT_203435 [Auriculariales sp. MPI-PUGE-AT-0066]